MLSFRRFNEELALTDLDTASVEILKFHGQNGGFIGWFYEGGTSLCLLQP